MFQNLDYETKYNINKYSKERPIQTKMSVP